MKYEVKVTEILQRVVTVEASSIEEAEEFVELMWDTSEIILDAEDFIEVTFSGVEP